MVAKMTKQLFVSTCRLHLKYNTEIWAPHYMELIEKVQRTKWWFENETTVRVWESWIFHHWSAEDIEMICSRCINTPITSTWSNHCWSSGYQKARTSEAMNIVWRRGGDSDCISPTCQHFFSSHVVNMWNSLPEKTMSAVSINSFKKCLDKTVETAQIYTGPRRFCKVEDPGKVMTKLIIWKSPPPIIMDATRRRRINNN